VSRDRFGHPVSTPAPFDPARSPRGAVRTFEDPDLLAHAVAARVAAACTRAVADRRPCRLGLSGGRTALTLFDALRRPEFRDLPWRDVQILFADERAVPAEHPDSNYRLVREALLEPLGVPLANAHRMDADAPDLEAAARAYEPQFEARLDLLVLGVGEDGHTASIFPGSPLVIERQRWVAAVVDSPKPPPRRLTITPRVIREAREAVVMVTGADKADAVARALEGDVYAPQVPAMLLRPADWYVDQAAAAGLTRIGR
jgi:6-phosphogluconolactonase